MTLCQFSNDEVAALVEEIKMLLADGQEIPALENLLRRFTEGATADNSGLTPP